MCRLRPDRFDEGHALSAATCSHPPKCLFYYPETAATTTAPAAEFFTIRDGLIADSVLIFDRLSYDPPQQD